MSARSTTPIRVLLDVTHFGVVQEDLGRAYNRTGIFRVIEHTVRSLSARPDVALTLCAPASTDHAIAFVEADADFRTLRFSPHRRRVAHRRRARLIEQYAREGRLGMGAFPARVASKLASAVNRVLDSGLGRITGGGLAAADVYHSPVYALPVVRTPGVRYILTVHDTIPILFPEQTSWNATEWLTGILNSIGPDDHVVADSAHTRNDLLNVRPEIAPERVHVATLAADPERFYPFADALRAGSVRTKYGIPNAPYVLSVATLEPRKNIAQLIRSFASVVRAERLDDLHLVLAGSKGWDPDAVFAAAGDVGKVRERIIFTGYVDDADLAPLYTGALAFVYPSLYEGFGLPPLEAMQCGTPVITSNTSSLPEVVGDAGLLVDPHDGDALAQALLAVYRDPALRADLAQRSLVRAREFSWARYAAQTVDAYRLALAGR